MSKGGLLKNKNINLIGIFMLWILTITQFAVFFCQFFVHSSLLYNGSFPDNKGLGDENLDHSVEASHSLKSVSKLSYVYFRDSSNCQTIG